MAYFRPGFAIPENRKLWNPASILCERMADTLLKCFGDLGDFLDSLGAFCQLMHEDYQYWCLCLDEGDLEDFVHDSFDIITNINYCRYDEAVNGCVTKFMEKLRGQP